MISWSILKANKW